MLNFIKKHAISIKISRHASKPIIQAILKILKIETGKLTAPQNKTKDNCFNCGAAGHWAHSCTELKKETRTCHYCNKVGHIKRKCFKFLKDTGSGVTLPFGAPCSFFAAPTNFLLSPKKKKKKKGRHFFFCFSYRLLAPQELFVPPNIFFASTER